VKAAAAVLGASLLFFLGVLTGVGRREAVPPPAAIPLGALNTPASGTPASTGDAPADGAKPTTTSTGATAPPATTPTGTPAATTGGPGATATTGPVATTAPTASPPAATTGTSGGVEQVDGQVDCRSGGRQGKGKREPCPSTTTSTAEAPGGRGNR
jgi:hypothetical protein